MRISLIYTLTVVGLPLFAHWEPGDFEKFLEENCLMNPGAVTASEPLEEDDDTDFSDPDPVEENDDETSLDSDAVEEDFIDAEDADPIESEYTEEYPLEAADTQEQIDCGRCIRTSLRYTSPKGIGYETGYSTLECFLATQKWQSWIPFIDVRGHVFDNGRFAANAGLGMRYVGNSRVWGFNAYYDYRNTSHLNCNQIAAGFEALGKIWDFRINGYLPVGKKDWSRSARFAFFEGNEMWIRSREKSVLRGGNAEVGLHVDHFKQAPLYFAGGPYYLNGKDVTTWGGQLRTAVDLFDRYISLEANVSYDHFFRWSGQGQMSVNIPFGKRCRSFQKNSSSTLCERALQRVNRYEIIPVSSRRFLNPAMNPSTGDPWIFWFVNNTSQSSLGTFQNPFSTLAAAQNASSPNQGIYVFPGDGSTTGMDSGITLQNSQLLLGAATPHPIPTTEGEVTIPSFAASAPSITNSGGDVVSLSSNDTVSGFSIDVPNGGYSGLVGTNISNVLVDHNQFTTAPTSSHAIFLTNASGTVTVSNNVIVGSINNDGINLAGSTLLDTLNISSNRFRLFLSSNCIVNNMAITNVYLSNNTFLGSVGGFNNSTTGTIETLNAYDNTFIALAINGLVNNGTMGTLNASFNSFEDIFSNGINNRATLGTLNAVSNTFNNVNTGINSSSVASIIENTLYVYRCSFDSGNGIVYTTSDSENVALQISDNVFVPPGGASQGYAADITVNQGTICLEFTGNMAPDSAPAAYQFTQGGSGTFNLTLGSDDSTNTGQFVEIGTFGTCSLP